MFNLDDAVAKWRRQMLAAGIKCPVPLDELECHLRDDVEHQVSSGVEARLAFAAAAGRMGPPTELKSEFETIAANLNHPQEPMKQKLTQVLAVLLVIAIEVGLILPALANWKAHGKFSDASVFIILVGALLLASGVPWAVNSFFKTLKGRPKA